MLKPKPLILTITALALSVSGCPRGFGDLDDLGHREHADQHGQDREAGVQLDLAEGEAGTASDRRDAHGGYCKTQHARRICP